MASATQRLAGAFALAALWLTGAAYSASTPNDPLGTVKRLYAAFDANDMAAVTATIADDAEWTYHGPAYALPFGGVFHGPQGVAEFFRVVDVTLTDVQAGQHEFLVSGDTVTVPGWEESTVRATGGHYKVANAHVFTVRDNRIVKFDEYIDSGEVLEAFIPADPKRGRALFTGCAICHGHSGEGNRYISAPALASMDATYLTRQLRNFREGIRGKMEDEHGWMMYGRANALPGDRGVRDVVAYIETLPAPAHTPDTSFHGAAERGKKLYQSCAACHGEHAEGNPSLKAPALRTLDPNYALRQLEHFASGIRGNDERDPLGKQMRAAVGSVPDAKAKQDVVAFVTAQ